MLDEPVRGVDYAGEAELYTLIGRLRTERGFGVLLVSHDLHVVMAQSDRVICLNRHVCCSGVPQSVAQHPEYVRACSARRRRAPSASTITTTTTGHDLAGEPQPRAATPSTALMDRRTGPDVAEPFLMRALLAGLGLAMVAAPLGCFVVWRRMAYYGEAVAQAALIGVALGLAFSLDLTASVLVVTLAVSGPAGAAQPPAGGAVRFPARPARARGARHRRHCGLAGARSPARPDGASCSATSSPSTTRICAGFILGGAVALGALVYIWRPLLSLAVHEDLAAAEGAATERTKFIFVLVLALVVAIAIKIVGVLLTIAFLIMPAAAARPLARDARADGRVRRRLRHAVGRARACSCRSRSIRRAGPSIVLVLAGAVCRVDLPVGAAPARPLALTPAAAFTVVRARSKSVHADTRRPDGRAPPLDLLWQELGKELRGALLRWHDHETQGLKSGLNVWSLDHRADRLVHLAHDGVPASLSGRRRHSRRSPPRLPSLARRWSQARQ